MQAQRWELDVLKGHHNMLLLSCMKTGTQEFWLPLPPPALTS